MSINNPLQYTSRTFLTALNDINSDPLLANKPDWFKRLIAGFVDVTSVWLNTQANNSYLRTGFTRQQVADMLALIDYQLSGQTTSQGDVLFYVRTNLGTAIFPFAVPKEELVANSQGGLVVSAKRFESRTDETFSLVQQTFTADNTTNELTVGTDIVYTGHKIRLSTTGTLPAGLNDTTDYYVIRIDATTIQLAENVASAFAGNNVTFSDNGTGTQTLSLFSKAVELYQQETKENINIGRSDGTTAFQEFNIPDSSVLTDTIEISIDSQAWTQVTTFVNSLPNDKNFKIVRLSEQQTAVQFGDGTYGEIPGNFDIVANYKIGGGQDSKIVIANTIQSYIGGNSNLSGVANPSTITGGSDEEDIETAKNISVILLKFRGQFISEESGEALMIDFGGISLAKINKNAFGILSAQAVAIANGGGNPSPSLKTDLQNLLIERSVLESIDVRVEDATITSIDVTASGRVISGFTWAQVEPFLELAFQLFYTETGAEIERGFIEGGISQAVDIINVNLSKSFTASDYATILPLVESLNPRKFGDTIQESDLFAYVDTGVTGLDYFTLTLPGSFPQTFANDEITTDGTISLTEIP